MARNEQDREDLMQEATAYPRRVEILADDRHSSVIAGFKSTGALSIYFGADPVYHWDSDGRLRRAFVDGCLYRTQGTTLARLTRQRSDDKTTLLRHDLTPAELQQFLTTMRARLAAFCQSLQSNNFQVLAAVPADADFRPEILNVLVGVLETDLPQLAPPIAGKK